MTTTRFDINIQKEKVTLSPSITNGKGIDGKIKKGSCCSRSFTIGAQSLNTGSLIDYINKQLSYCSDADKQKYVLKKGWFFGWFGSSNAKIRQTLKFLQERVESAPVPQSELSKGNATENCFWLGESDASKEINVPVDKPFSIKLWHFPQDSHKSWDVLQIPPFITLSKVSKESCNDQPRTNWRSLFDFKPNGPGKGDIVMQSCHASQTKEKRFTIIADPAKKNPEVVEKLIKETLRVPANKPFSIRYTHSMATGWKSPEILKVPSFINFLTESTVYPGSYYGGGTDQVFHFEPTKPGTGEIVFQKRDKGKGYYRLQFKHPIIVE